MLEDHNEFGPSFWRIWLYLPQSYNKVMLFLYTNKILNRHLVLTETNISIIIFENDLNNIYIYTQKKNSIKESATLAKHMTSWIRPKR